MRVSPFSTFRKHWGQIDKELKAGKYNLVVVNNYDVSAFNGEKYVILTTVNSLGGNNNILGGCFIAVGVLSIILCAVFIIILKMKQRKETVVITNNPQNLSEVLFRD